MRQRLIELLAVAIVAFLLGVLVNARRARADGAGLVHIYDTRHLLEGNGNVAGRVVGFTCIGNVAIPKVSTPACLVVTQEP